MDYKYISTLKNLNKILDINNRMKNSYMCVPSDKRAERLKYEQRNSFIYTFKYSGELITIKQVTTCCISHVIYRLYIIIDGRLTKKKGLYVQGLRDLIKEGIEQIRFEGV